jgi:hypothetical protein
MDPNTYAQGAMLLWEKQKQFDKYLKSPEYKATVLARVSHNPNFHPEP